jgi:hypothetical protein
MQLEYSYTIMYKNTKNHSNADGLSRLPLAVSQEESCDTVAMFHISQIAALPVSVKEIGKESESDILNFEGLV